MTHGDTFMTTDMPDLILHRGVFTTLDRSNPTASAVAIKDGRRSEEHTSELQSPT